MASWTRVPAAVRMLPAVRATPNSNAGTTKQTRQVKETTWTTVLFRATKNSGLRDSTSKSGYARASALRPPMSSACRHRPVPERERLET